MRQLCILGCLLGGFLGTTDAHAEACRWSDDPKSALRNHGNIVVLAREYECPGKAQGTLKVELKTELGGRSTVGETSEDTVKPQGKWWRKGRIIEKLFPSKLCELKPPAPARAKGARPLLHDGRWRVVYPIRVRAEVSGTGPLAPLKWNTTLEAPCDLCGHHRGSVGVYEGRAMVRTFTKASKIRMKAEGPWFECVRKHSNLQMRVFKGASAKEAQGAIRPTMVVDHLEKSFHRNGKDYSLEIPFPHRKLCAKAGAGQHFTWELWGKGPLMNISGGGRTTFSLKCR